MLWEQLFGTQLVHCVERGPEQYWHVGEHGWHTWWSSAKNLTGQRVTHWPLCLNAWAPIDMQWVHWLAPGPLHELPQLAWQGTQTPNGSGACPEGHSLRHRPLWSRGSGAAQLVHILLVALQVACKVALQSLGQLTCTLHSRSRQFEAPCTHEG